MADRPKTVECEICGEEIEVAAKGRIPRYHPACRDGERAPSAAEAGEPETPPADVEAAESTEPSAAPERPALRQVAPIVWVDEAGNRYTSDPNDGFPNP